MTKKGEKKKEKKKKKRKKRRKNKIKKSTVVLGPGRADEACGVVGKGAEGVIPPPSCTNKKNFYLC